MPLAQKPNHNVWREMQMHYYSYGTNHHMFQLPTWETRRLSQWVAEVRKPSHQGKVQSLRHGIDERDGCVQSANLLLGESVVQTRPTDFSYLDLGNLAVSKTSCFLRVA
ncbi:hypothetical protein CSKR_106917 [Clonorchis sinensis]|uniref:Uncharacterized protein n=1 Tax=Clonorchis sinensis TaxID=79923 RepID=A0A3R7EYR9_CLOSI|nr:hypothetical protein CSKR_106917 [Clonorchis sinensis]